LRILVVSDIHGNLEGLEACLAAAQSAGGYDRVFNLGDIVGYGANPNEVVARSREMGGVYVRGNHDKACSGITDAEDFNHIAALAAFWTKQKLTPENLEWVRALPQGPITSDGIAGVQCVHGSPIHEDEYIIVVRDAYEPLTETQAMLTFFGHTHIQGGFAVDGEEWLTLRPMYKSSDAAETFTFPMKKTAKYLINPGSAGQPRDGDWRAACCIFDTEKHAIQFLRIPYDVKTAQKKILDANLPDRLASRLSEGR
jgi:predicted phosphodiesterase